jgi:hypothetical protein
VEHGFASLDELLEDPFVLSGRDPNPGPSAAMPA